MVGLTLALACILLAVWLWAARRPYKLGGFTTQRIVDPPVSLADLRRIGSGEPLAPSADPDELVRRLLATTDAQGQRRMHYFEPGDHGISVGLVSPSGSRGEMRRIGWPLVFFERGRTANYVDAANKHGFVPSRTDPTLPPITDWSGPSDSRRMPPTWRWRYHGGVLTCRLPPEEAGGKPTMTMIRFAAMAPIVALLIVAWWLPKAIGVVVWRRGGRPEREIRLAQWFTLLVAALVILTANVASVRDSDSPPLPQDVKLVQAVPGNQPVYWTRRGFARLPSRWSSLESLLNQPGADARLAAEILSTLPPTAVDADRFVLAAALETESVFHNHEAVLLNESVPLLWLRWDAYWRRADLGTPEPVPTPRGTRLEYSAPWFVLTLATGRAELPAFRAMLNLQTASLILVLLAALAAAVTGVRAVVEHLRAARRVRCSQCPCCRYPVASQT